MDTKVEESLKYASKEEAINDHKSNYRSEGYAKGKFDPYGPDRLRIDRIRGAVPDGAIVLDVGCNDGSMGLLLQTKNRCTVFGIDVVGELVVRANLRGIIARVQNVENLEFKDSFFDAVVMGEVLEHCYDPYDALKEIHRVLKPGGVFSGSVPHPGGGMGGEHHKYADFHQSLFQTDELESKLSIFFKDVEIKGTPYLKSWCLRNNINTDVPQWNNFVCKGKHETI